MASTVGKVGTLPLFRFPITTAQHNCPVRGQLCPPAQGSRRAWFEEGIGSVLPTPALHPLYELSVLPCRRLSVFAEDSGTMRQAAGWLRIGLPQGEAERRRDGVRLTD